MDKSPLADVHTTAHFFLEGLNEIGIEYLFCNLGTDYAPLIEEMARWRKKGIGFPRTVLCPHENVAMHMAAGYACMTGRGQGVMVHVDAGTANAAMATHNLFRARWPVLLMAGRAPFTIHGERSGSRDTYVHFVQEPFDQGNIVRSYVKWEYTLHTGVTTKETLRRAHAVMQSDPKGPVYLVLPREVLAETWDSGAVRSYPQDRYGPSAAAGADPALVQALAERLLTAGNPLLITAYAGRNAEAVAALDELARFAGIRVIEYHPLYLNIPHDSPCFAGFKPGRHVAQADVGLLVDVDVPWIPTGTPENPATFWAHIDLDVVKGAFPMWGFPGNLRIAGDSGRILGQMLDALKSAATPAFREAAARRVAVLAREKEERRQGAARLAGDPGVAGRINPHYLCAELGRAIDPEDIVLQEAVTNAPAVFAQVPRSRPGSLIGCGAGGGLGFSGGMALGVKLARPERTVIQLAGDGVFHFCNPDSVYAVSAQYGLPIFTVVLDNAGWGAVKEATLQMYPDGEARASGRFEAALGRERNFAKVAESAGAHGETVNSPEHVPAAIRRCLEEVRAGRSALLHARVTPI